MQDYKTPGVYVEEIPKFPASVAQVASAIPAFIGYTEKQGDGNKYHLLPTRISSLAEYADRFGGPKNEAITVTATETSEKVYDVSVAPINPTHLMYYSLEMYFANGGGACYIVSVGTYVDAPEYGDNGTKSGPAKGLIAGLNKLKEQDEPTLIVFPDATKMTTKYANLLQDALMQCNELQDRFVIMDAHPDISTFRNLSSDYLKYGAAYYPSLVTSLNYSYLDAGVTVGVKGLSASKAANSPLSELKTSNNALYNQVKDLLALENVVLPPSSAISGVYARVDRENGVWKAPANVSLNAVIKPSIRITDKDQEDLNVHTTGKSINAIRAFSGKGTLVWGARTLDGNSNEWRFVSVRRFFNMVEESIKKGTGWVVFEPNDANTWIKVKAQIENFLILQWRAGALAGAVSEDAFYVNVGLNTTMTEQDINEGRLIIEIGLATSRPAEFIVLRFSHKLQQS